MVIFTSVEGTDISGQGADNAYTDCASILRMLRHKTIMFALLDNFMMNTAV